MSDTARAPLALHVFSSFAVGGAQARFAAIANALGKRWRHMIVAMDGDLACREKLAPALDVSFPDIAMRKGATAANIRAIRAALRDWRPDVLVTANFGTIEWAMANARIAGGPLARHVHMEDGYGPDERDRQIARRVWLRRLFLRRAEIIVPSQNLLRIARLEWRLPAARVHYVPNGIDLARFSPATRDWHDPPIIGTVAALRAEKNVGRLVRAFALLRQPARLLITGDGPEMPALRALANERGVADRVTFAGHNPTPERAYRDVDIFALSSDTEQMPLSVLEAMASGLPIAASDVGDVRAMVSTDNAACIVARDDAALAEALDRLLANPGTARRFGALNRLRAEELFDEDTMFATHEALWRGTR
jgi:glycosyltransferase involved in cell wall biosynthesis